MSCFKNFLGKDYLIIGPCLGVWGPLVVPPGAQVDAPVEAEQVGEVLRVPAGRLARERQLEAAGEGVRAHAGAAQSGPGVPGILNWGGAGT